MINDSFVNQRRLQRVSEVCLHLEMLFPIYNGIAASQNSPWYISQGMEKMIGRGLGVMMFSATFFLWYCGGQF